MNATPEELLRALAYARDCEFARLTVTVLALAAQTHPEELRTALESVFSLECVREAGLNTMRVLDEVQKQAAETRHELRQLKRDIAAAQLQLESLERRLE